MAMIEAAEREGRIEPGRTTIVEATSGNTGIALAFVCAAKGYDLILTLPQGMSREREGLLRLYGAQVHITESMGGMNEAVAAARAMARDRRRLPARPVLQPRQPGGPPPHHRPGAVGGDGRQASTTSWRASARAARSPAPARFLKERNQDMQVDRGRAGDLGGALRRARPGRTRSRASARASSRRCSTATLLDEIIAVDDEDAIETARARRPPRGRAVRHLRAARRCGRRCRSPRARRPRASGSRSCCPTRGERYVSTPFFAPEADAARVRMTGARSRAPPARRGSARCTARSTGSWSSPSCSRATRSATPPRRPAVRLPPARASSSTTRSRCPSVYVIQGYTGQLDMWFDRASRSSRR